MRDGQSLTKNLQAANAWKWFLETILVAVFYVLTGKLGFLIAIPPGNVTTVWPPSGIALAALLIFGRRLWPGIWAGSFLVNFLFFMSSSLSPPAIASSVIIATGSTLQALVGASLIHRFISNSPAIFDRARNVFKFTAIEFFCCFIAPTFGVTSLWFGHFISRPDYFYSWWTWWTGDLIGVMIVAPLLVVWARTPRVRWSLSAFAEGALLFTVLGVSGEAVFGRHLYFGAFHYPIGFAVFPALMWIAFRFGPPGVTIANLAVAGGALAGTVQGFGPFVREDLHESLLLLQAYIGTVTLTALALAAAVRERRETETQMRGLTHALERRVAERTAALGDANRSLEKEVLQRKEAERELLLSNLALKKKLKELERLNRIMLGREERIIELKNEVRQRGG